MMRRSLSGALAALLLAGGCTPKTPPVAAPPGRALEAPKVVAGLLEAGPLLADLPAKVGKLGAGPVALVASGPLAEGERVGAFVEIPKDACLLAYARSSAALEDIDLAAFGEEGNPVAVDEGPDPKPTVLVCPPHPDRVYVAVHAASGEGLAVIAAQLVPRERAAEIGRVAGARGANPRAPETWPGLDDQVKGHRRAIGGTWEESRRVAVAVDARAPSTVGFTVEENGCSDALVVPDDDVSVLDVDVLDGDGRLVARAHDTTPTRSVTVCSPAAVAGTLQIRPHVGRGLVAVVLGRAKGDSSRELGARPETIWVGTGRPLEVTRAAREKALRDAGYPAGVAQLGQLQLGRRLTLPLEVGPACTRVDVVAGAPLALVDAAVWDDAGNLLGTGEGADGAVVFACGKTRARVDLGTRGRPGPFALLARAEPWKDASFAAHPLAAGRMLARASGPLVPARADGKVTFAGGAVLETTRRWGRETTVPAGQCARLAIGVEGEGTGLEVRAFDPGSGEELDRGHGQVSAAVTACAGTAPRPIRFEARATAGKLDAVVGERLVGSGG